MRGKRFSSLWFVPLGLLLVTAAACGSSSDGGGGTLTPTAVSTYAKIQGFGSIFVNGVEYDTSKATFSEDDSDGISQSDLRVGMMVTVHGSINDDGQTGTADSVDYEDNLEGPIGSIDAGTNSFVALGQTVIVDANTVFDDALTFDQLAVGDFVEVSGIVDAQGNILATFIERTGETCATIDEIEVKGTVSNLDTNALTFTLGSLTVDYSVADLSDVPGGLTDGLFVEVKSNQCPVADTLVATSIEAEDEFGEIDEDEEGEEAEIEGFVTAVTSSTEFEVGGQPVRITDQTEFDGLTPDQIALNLQLEVEGTVENGVLVAEEIQLSGEEE